MPSLWQGCGEQVASFPTEGEVSCWGEEQSESGLDVAGG